MSKNASTNSPHDADYDRWGTAPGSIRVVKAPKSKTSKTKSKTSATKRRKK